MKVLILAAGYGTRLYPLVKDTPKCLLEVANKPLLNHLLDKFRDFDKVQEFIVVTNNKFYSHFLEWAEKYNNQVAPITVINDGTNTNDDRLGSVGDIKFVVDNHDVGDDLLVLGGDNLFDYSLIDFYAFAQSKKSHVVIGLYDIGDAAGASKFGVVEIDEEGRVISFEEKPAAPKSSLIAMCSYYLPQATLGFVNEYVGQVKKTDKAGDYIHWLAEQKGVYGFTFEGKWYDIGSVESYQEAQKNFKNK